MLPRSSIQHDRCETPVDSAMTEGLEPRVLLAAYLYEPQSGIFEAGGVGQVVSVELAGERGGGSLTVLGDVDGDGVNDLAGGYDGELRVGHGSTFLAGFVGVYSGKTGTLIRELTDGGFGFGSAVAGIGDVNMDGVPDLVISSFRATSRGDTATSLAIYSGADGALILRRDADGTRALGERLQAIGDINSDGMTDFVSVDSESSTPGQGPRRLVAYSGADLSILWSGEATLTTEDQQVVRSLSSVGDLDLDGTPDLAVVVAADDSSAAGTLVRLVSGATGEVIREWAFAASGSDASSVQGPVSSVSDRDGDGQRDIAMYRTFTTDWWISTRSELAFYSSATGALLTPLRNVPASGVALAVGDTNGDGFDDFAIATGGLSIRYISGFNGEELGSGSSTDAARSISDIVIAGDLDGDGVVDLAIGSNSAGNNVDYPEHSVYTVSGPVLTRPAVAGFNDAHDAWGTIGDEAFITISGRAVLVSALTGFQAGDRVIRLTTSGVVLGRSASDDGFVRLTSGERIDLALLTFPLGASGQVTPVAISDDGAWVLVGRAFNAEQASWSVHVTTGEVDLLFAGSPVALSPDGTTFVGISPSGVDTIVVRDGLTTTVPSFVAVALAESGGMIGTRASSGPDIPAYARSDSSGPALIDLATLDGATLVPRFIRGAIAGQERIVASYTVANTSIESWATLDGPSAAPVDITLQAWLRGPIDFEDHVPLEVLALSDRGDLAGIYHGDRAFSLRPTDVSLLESDAGAPLDSTPWLHSYGKYSETSIGTATATINPLGQLVVMAYGVPWDAPYYVSTKSWQAYVINAPDGYAFTSSVAIWQVDGGTLVAAATTDHGLLAFNVFTGGLLDLSIATRGTPITRSLVKLALPDGRRLLAGLDANNDLVLYGENAPATGMEVGWYDWAFDNLSQSVFRNANLTPPMFDTDRFGSLVAYTTPWGGLNLAGVDIDGSVQVVWTAPDVSGWVGSDLTQAVGVHDGYDGRILSNLRATVTSWGGISIYGGADARVFWWAPDLGSTWRYAVLSLETPDPGPELLAATADTLTSSWDGISYSGLDADGHVQVYWWAATPNIWQASHLDADFGEHRAAYAGRLSAIAPPNGQTIVARDTIGHVHWINLDSTGTWMDVDVSRVAIDPVVW